MADTAPSFFARLVLAWVAFFRIVFDAAFAARVDRARRGDAGLPPAAEPVPAKEAERPAAEPAPGLPSEADSGPALQLLALFQREGRLVDFLEQDIASFPDSDIGAAARVVHEGCRKALRDHAEVEPIRSEEEGAIVVVESGFAPAEIKLTGNVKGSAPYRGALRHRGWRVQSLRLPRAMKGHDPSVVAPAEIELA